MFFIIKLVFPNFFEISILKQLHNSDMYENKLRDF